MKIGTVSKITVGVIAIIVLVFIGSRQLLSPEENSSPSTDVAASTTNKPEQSAHEIEASRKNVVTAPSRADEPQISAEEMEQIESFFTQLDEADARSEPETSQLATNVEANQDTEEDYTPDPSATFESTEQSAEDVMGAYVEALKDLDSETMLSLVTSDFRKESRSFWNLFDDSDSDSDLNEVLRWAFGQAKVVESKHVGGEFHFRLRVQLPIGLLFEKVPWLEGNLPPEAQRLLEKTPRNIPILHKMRKESGVWRIYEF